MTAEAVAQVPFPLPFRLRTALGVLLLGAAAALLVPRALAAYRLQGLVSKYADYGLCMAGPTGSVLLREDPAQFRKLVRRRLVAAPPQEAPFARCGKLAAELTGQPFADVAHQAQAGTFVEWGNGASAHQLSELYGELPDLEALAAKSVPFSRKPLSELIKPSLGAKEAVHPTEPARPGRVDGLRLGGARIRSTLDTPRGPIVMLSTGQEPWALRSRDQGRTWSPTSPWQAAVEGHANRCVTRPLGPSYGILSPELSGGRPSLIIDDGAMGQKTRRDLSNRAEQVTSLSCDETGAVVLTEAKAPRRTKVYACPLASAACKEVPLPPQAMREDVMVDVARVAHTIVIAVSKDGLVRVTTSRDEGATMTPLSLVFDAGELGAATPGSRAVPTLLPFGRRLLLHLRRDVTGSSAAGSALVSEDFGASFRTF